MPETKPIQAVYDDDLSRLLNALGVLRPFEAGEANCEFCGTQVGPSNLHAVFPLRGKVALSCDNPSCVARLNELLSEG